MKPSCSNRFLSLIGRILTTPAIFITILGSANAANRYWDGGTANIATNGDGASGGTTGNWGTTLTNWDQGSALAHVVWNNASNDTALFGGTAGTVTITAPVTAGALTFTTAGYTLAGTSPNILTLAGTAATITTSSLAASASTTISTPIAGTPAGGLVIASNGDVSASGGGSAGRGVILSGTNTFTGDVTITSGLVNPSSDAAFGNAANKIILNGGGLLDNGTNVAISRAIQIGAAGGILRAYGTTTTANLSGEISGSSTLARTDGGTIILSGNNTFTGTFNNSGGNTVLTGTNTAATYNINAGYIQIGNNGTTGSIAATSTANIGAGLSLFIKRTDAVSATGILPGTITFASATSRLEYNPNSATATLNFDRDLGTDVTKGYFRVSGGTLSLASGTDIIADTTSLGLQSGTVVGTLNILPGSTLTTRFFNIGETTNNSGIVNQSGGTVTLSSGSSGFRLGHWTNGTNPANSYNLSGGTLDATALSANTTNDRYVNIGWDGQGTMTVGGGAGTATLKAAGIQLDASGDTAANMTLTLSTNGVVEVGSLGILSAAAGDALILNGGTIKSTASSTWAPVIQVNTGTSTLDINGTTLVLSNNITGSGTLALSDTAGGGGGVIQFNGGTSARSISSILTGSANLYKLGSGALTLSSASTNTGNLFVDAGSLVLTGSTAATVSLADTTTLSGEGTIGGNLNFGNSTGANLLVDPTTAGALSVTGTVTLGGFNKVSFTKPPVANVANKIFSHNGLTGTLGTDLFVEDFDFYRSPTLVNTGTAVEFSFVGKNLTWNSSESSDWDIATSSNWSDPASSTFYAGDSVTFDNSAPSNDVILSSTVSPSLVTFSSDYDYTLTGSGSIAGPGSLVKSGPGYLTISTSNTYTGTTSVNEGLLKLGNNNALGSSASGTIIASGATLDVNGRDLSNIPEAISVSGIGTNGIGAIINTNATVGTLNSVSLTGDTTFNLANNLVIGVNASGTSGNFSLGGNTLTKTGAGRLILNGVSVTSGNIIVNQGVLQLCTSYISGGGGNQQAVNITTPGTITINAGASLSTNRYAPAFSLTSPIILNGGTIQGTGPGPNGATIASNISLTANSTFDFNAGGYSAGLSNVVFGGVISGAFKLTRIGGTNDIVSLTGANTYSGGTTITSGTVGFNSGSLGTTGAITMDGGILRWNTGNIQDVSPRITFVNGKTASFDPNSNAVVLASPLGGGTTCNFLKLGTGTLTLSAINTFTGGTAVRAGTLSVSSMADTNSNLGSGTASTSYVEVTQGGTLQYTGSNAATLTKYLWMDTGSGATIDVSNAAGSITWNPGGGTRNIPFTKAGAGALTLNGVISGTATVTVSAGTLSLGSANTYTKGTTLSGGVMTVSNDNQLGAAYDGSLVSPLTVTAGGAGYTSAPTVTVSAPNSGVTATATATIASGAVNAVTIGTNGTGYVANPTITFTGGGGTTTATATAQVKGLLTLNGGTLQTTAAITSNRATVLGTSGATINTNGFNSTFSGVFNGSGALTKTGTGTLTLSGANTATGATTVSTGSLALNYATQNNSKLADAAVLTLSGTASVDLAGGSHTEIVGSTTLSTGAAATITRSSGTSVLQLGTITRGSQTSTLSLSADNIATTNNTNTGGILGLWATVNGVPATNSTNAANGPIVAYTGYTDVPFAGTISDGSATNVRLFGGTSGNIGLGSTLTSIQSLYQGLTSATIVDTASKTLAFGNGGGIFIPTTGGALTIGTAANSGTITAGTTANSELILVNNSANLLTINSVIANNATGAVLVTKTGSGPLTLTGTNTYTGATNIVAGIVNIQSAAALGTTAAGTTVQNGAALEIQGGITTLAEPLSISGTGTTPTGGVLTNVSGNNTFAGPISLAAASTISVAASTTLTTSGAWTIPSTLTKIGTGTLKLTTYSGSSSTAANDIVINEGAIEFSTGYFNANPFPFHSLDITVNNGATLRTTVAHSIGGDNIDAGAPMSQVRINTGGTFQVNGTQYLTGGTVSGQGRLVLTGGTVNGSATLNAVPNAAITTLASATTSTISNSGGINLQYGTLTFDVADGAAATDLSVTNALTSTNGVTKTGAGLATFSGTSTYAGATTVSGGTFLMNGTVSGTGAVTSALGTTLGGTGGFAGPVTVSGTLAPGTAIESLATGALALASGSTLAAEINSSGSPAADVVNVTGNVSLAGALSVNDLAITPVALANNTKLTLITYTGSLTGTFTGLAEGAQIVVGPNTFKISYVDAGAVTLTAYVADPYLAWATGAPYNLTGNDSLPGSDPDKDGIPNVIEYILGGNPATVNDSSKLPTAELVTTDVGNGTLDYLKFTYRRSDAAAYLNPAVQYDTDLAGTWSTAVNGTGGVVVVTSNDFYAPSPNGIDRVTYYLPRSLAAPGSSLFGRLKVTTP